MFRTYRWLLAGAIALSGCSAAQIAALDAAGGTGVLTSEPDAFDGTHRVRLTPAWVRREGEISAFAWDAPFKVGALWQSDEPGQVVAVIELPNAIRNVQGLAVNRAGEISNYAAVGATQFNLDRNNPWISKESVAFVPMPLGDFLALVEDDDARLRTLLGAGEYADADFAALRGGAGALTARHYLAERFVPEVIKQAALARSR